MHKIQLVVPILILCCLPISIFSISVAKENMHKGGPYYFGSFVNYIIPFHPIEELNQEDAKTRDAYYIAYYNANGKIVSFSKYLYGEIEFTDNYFYGVDGQIQRRELTKSNGQRTVQYFDKDGKIVTDK